MSSVVVGENRRPVAEEVLDDLSSRFCHGETWVAHGRELEAPGSHSRESAVCLHVATSHTSATDETDG